MRLSKLGLPVLLVLTVGVVQASPDDPAAGGGATASVSVSAKLSAQDMLSRGNQLVSQMEEAQRGMVELQLVARRAAHIIRRTGVNDKLLQVKQLLNIAEVAKGCLEAGTDEARQHAYTEITISSEKITTLRGDAEGCVGEGEMFVGKSKLTVSAPRIVNDPTLMDPFRFANIEIERPTYATPYL